MHQAQVDSTHQRILDLMVRSEAMQRQRESGNIRNAPWRVQVVGCQLAQCECQMIFSSKMGCLWFLFLFHQFLRKPGKAGKPGKSGEFVWIGYMGKPGESLMAIDWGISHGKPWSIFFFHHAK